MLKLEKFPNIIQYAVYTHPYRLCIYYANFFWESTNENANLSLGTGMGFSYCVHLIIKPKTWQFWVMTQTHWSDLQNILAGHLWIIMTWYSTEGIPLKIFGESHQSKPDWQNFQYKAWACSEYLQSHFAAHSLNKVLKIGVGPMLYGHWCWPLE